jgi:hypothetical protein
MDPALLAICVHSVVDESSSWDSVKEDTVFIEIPRPGE